MAQLSGDSSEPSSQSTRPSQIKSFGRHVPSGHRNLGGGHLPLAADEEGERKKKVIKTMILILATTTH